MSFKISNNVGFSIIFRNKHILLCIDIKNPINKSKPWKCTETINNKNIHDINIDIKSTLAKKNTPLLVKSKRGV